MGARRLQKKHAEHLQPWSLMIHELSTTELRWVIDEKKLDLPSVDTSNTHDAPNARPSALGQERALSALELGLGIPSRGFNIFVVGASGTGRTSTVLNVLKEKAKGEKTPDDTILVYNFDDRDRPLALRIPSAKALLVKKAYESFVEKMLLALEKAFESDGYNAERAMLDDKNAAQTDALLEGTEKEATDAGFILSRTGNALTLAVADEEGQPMAEEAFEALDQDVKDALEGKLRTKKKKPLADVLYAMMKTTTPTSMYCFVIGSMFLRRTQIPRVHLWFKKRIRPRAIFWDVLNTAFVRVKVRPILRALKLARSSRPTTATLFCRRRICCETPWPGRA